MKYCQFCGSEINDNSDFCEKCGKSLNENVVEKQQPKKGEKCCKTCGEIHEKKLKYCPNCGVNSRQVMSAKTTKCKECGHTIAINAVSCPSCGKKTHYNLKIVAVVIGIFLLLTIVMVALLSGESSAPATAPTESTEQSTVLLSDDFFEVEFMNVSDVPAVTACSLQLKITNKSGKKVTLLLDDVYVNDIAIESGTGMPIELEPGKISTTPFILFTGNTGLSAEDITDIECNLIAMDDDYQRIYTSPKFTIENN